MTQEKISNTKATAALFRDGQVARVDLGWGVYFIKALDPPSTEEFDVVLLNRYGAFCHRDTVYRGWVKRRMKSSAVRDIEWSVDSDKTTREFWPLEQFWTANNS